MISDREDSSVVHKLLDGMKTRSPNVTVSAIMTDDGKLNVQQTKINVLLLLLLQLLCR